MNAPRLTAEVLAQQCAVLEQENALLRETIDMLKLSLADPTKVPACLGLTPTEATVFACLATRPDLATKDQIMTALYAERPGEVPETKITDVFISKVRRKVEPFGIVIETVWGMGWRLPSASRATLNELRAAS